MKKSILMLAATAFLFTSCGEGETSSPETDEPTTQQEETPAATESEVEETVELTIEGNDQMKFNLDRLEAVEGQKVILTLKHVGTMPKETMGHNWILLKKGTSVEEFGLASATAKENNYVSPDHADKIIAMTQLIGGGEQTTVEFDAPSAGIYDFICSFPGHFGMMKGKFVVRKE